MADLKPFLTQPLREEKEQFIVKRNELARQLDILDAQIESIDMVISIYDDEHVATDVRTSRYAAPMLELKPQAQLPASEPTPASDPVPPPAPQDATKAETAKKPVGKKQPSKTAKKAKAAAKPKKAAAQKAAEEVVEPVSTVQEEAKPRQILSDEESQFIADYYDGFDRKQTILEVLSGHKEPVKAQLVQDEIFAIYPLNAPSARLKNLTGARIGAALQHMIKRGHVKRHEANVDGKKDVRWTLTAVARKELRKTQKAAEEASAAQLETAE